MIELYKLETIKNKVYIKVLTYNPKVWYQWSYLFFKDDSYPTSDIKYAKSYSTEAEAMMDVNKYIPFKS